MFPRPFLHRVLKWLGPSLLLICGLLKVAQWDTDWLWFQAAGYQAQFSHLTAWRAGCFSLGAAAFAFWLGLNAHLAWRNAARAHLTLSFFQKSGPPRFIPPEDKLQLDGFRRAVTVLIVALCSWLAGAICAARYATFLRACYSQGLGQFDLASGYDLSFFLFQLPLWHLLNRLCFMAIVAALVLVLAIYLFEETLGLGHPAAPLVPSTSRHLAILWALLLLWRGADCLLSVPQSFVNSGNVATRVFDLANIHFGWTSAIAFAVSAPLWALLSGLAIARHPRPRPFLLSLGWFLAAGAVPSLLPLMVGHGSQDPQWKAALTRHIISTRRAWDLESLQRQSLFVAAQAPFRPLEASRLPQGLSPLPLWPEEAARAAMNARLNSQQNPARVGRLVLERDGTSLHYLGVVLPSLTPGESGEVTPLQSATGQVFAMDASRSTPRGEPIISAETAFSGYFGPESESEEPENLLDSQPWLVVAARPGLNGVSLQSPLTRLALAGRFFEPQLLRAGLSGGQFVLWHRGAAERCAQIAPFLDWPAADARPLLLPISAKPTSQRRLIWIVPGLIWSDDYPDSATPATNGTSPLGVNYGRQAALGVVDGLTGQVSLFALDEDEPYIALYRRAFPGLFAPLTSLPNPIRAALRPASALLQAQALIWTRYHETDPLAWAARDHDLRPWGWSLGQDNALSPAAADPSGQWLFLPLASVGGQAGAPGGASPLSAILGADEGDFAARRGHVRWRQWRPARPILLPDAAALPLQKLGPGRLIDPPPTRIALAPRLDAQGRATGLLLARGEVPLPGAEGVAAVAPRLDAHLWLAGESFGLRPLVDEQKTPRFNETQTQNLTQARSAWHDLLTARQKGDWNGVERAEKRLDRALGEPLEAP